MKVHVYLLESTREYDMKYTYLAQAVSDSSDALLARGAFVSVPFGPRNTPREALVWDCEETSDLPEDGTDGASRRYRLKQILHVKTDVPPLNEQELALCGALRERYLCTVGDAVRCVRPYRRPQEIGTKIRFASLAVSAEEVRAALAAGSFRNIGQIRILEILLESGEAMACETLAVTAGCSSSVLKTLEKRGYIQFEIRKVDRLAGQSILPSSEEQLPTYDPHLLNKEQQHAYDTVRTQMDSERPGVYLLHGVTGSGKTEIYMQLISYVLSRGGNAVVLVPEISLTPQLMSHFTARFGTRIAVLHSRMPAARRIREWHRIERGEVQIVIGARSAVFAPFARIDLMILDEAHDGSYQAEEGGLKYHAQEVAEMRCGEHGVVLYGSATPGVEMFFRAARGEIGYLPLKTRAGNRPLPTVILSDLRDERGTGTGTPIFGAELLRRMRENYKKGYQTLLFVGRRGYSSGMLCRECGKSMKCGKCNVAMTYHASSARLVCHYCGNTAPAPVRCPSCGSSYLDTRGIGTERVESELRQLFPEAEILRMDADTTAKRDGHARILRAFADGKAQFLVGTQMITKGHDFPGVTLVGVLNADSLLNVPEFRSEERAFQLLTQVSGRAGRGEMPGAVVLQAYDVDNYAILAAQHHSYEEFYRNEIAIRNNLWYPPYCTVCSLLLSCTEDREGFLCWKEEAGRLHRISERVPFSGAVEILGPSRAPVPKVNGRYRWLITVKAQHREDSQRLLKTWISEKKLRKDMRLSFIFE